MTGLHARFTSAVTKAIAVFSPGRALDYARKQALLADYNAAAVRGANQAWRPGNRSADEIIRREGRDIRARARDLERNSPNVYGAIDRIVSNVVFNGIWPQAELKREDGEPDKERNDRIEEHWERWAEAVDFVEIQELVLRHQWFDGEILAHWYLDPQLLVEGLCPLGVELLEIDHLDESVHGEQPGGTYAKRGIEYDRRGRPVAYHLFTEHPGDMSRFLSSRSVRVPAEDIDHIFMRRRSSQSRGVAWLASIVQTMRNIDEYKTSEQLAARLAAAFGIFVTTNNPEIMAGGIGRGGVDLSKYPSIDDVPDFIDPARITVMPAGTDIKVAEFNRPGGSYEPFTKGTLKDASVGAGMSYEAFSNDYTDASYSSARTAALEERRGYQRQQHFLNRKFNERAWRRFCRVLAIAGLEPLDSYRVPVTWQAPGWQWVDPRNDSTAAEKDIGLGLSTRRKLCADRGLDFDEVVEQLAREKRMLEEAGLWREPGAKEPAPQEDKEPENADKK